MIALDKTKTYLIDLDGTMYRGNQVIAKAVTFIQLLQKHHVSYVFVTNNATRTRKQNLAHMEHLGFSGIKEADFFTSATAAVSYMKKHSNEHYVYAVGEQGLFEAIGEGGYEIDKHKAKLVFVGLARDMDYQSYSEAARILRQNHALLIGTNQDRRIPEGDSFSIGNGAIVEMLRYASEAETILIGKPNPPMMEEVLAYVGKSKEECIVIGDNLETDIAFAKDNGLCSIMVCSGVHTKADAAHFRIKSDIVIESLDELYIK